VIILKKLLFVAVLTVCILFAGTPAYAETSVSIELNNSERLEAILMTLLMPEISKAVNDFYEPYLDTQPTVAAYHGAQITNIEGHKITIEIQPYIGPHISIGKERITFSVAGVVTMEKYEHLESYPLPPHKQSLLKKPLP